MVPLIPSFTLSVNDLLVKKPLHVEELENYMEEVSIVFDPLLSFSSGLLNSEHCPPGMMREVVWQRFGPGYTEKISRYRDHTKAPVCLVYSQAARWADTVTQVIWRNEDRYRVTMEWILSRILADGPSSVSAFVVPSIPKDWVYDQFLPAPGVK